MNPVVAAILALASLLSACSGPEARLARDEPELRENARSYADAILAAMERTRAMRNAEFARSGPDARPSAH